MKKARAILSKFCFLGDEGFLYLSLETQGYFCWSLTSGARLNALVSGLAVLEPWLEAPLRATHLTQDTSSTSLSPAP